MVQGLCIRARRRPHCKNCCSSHATMLKDRKVSGHGFSRAVTARKRRGALAPAMAIPARNASPANIQGTFRTFFVTTKTCMGRALLQSERNALLLVDVLRSCIRKRRFSLHDFVIMPDHIHLLMTIDPDMTIEKAMQFIKGGFSYRLKKESSYTGEVWQRGFSEVRIYDDESYRKHREYIARNPVKRGLVDSADTFPFCFSSLAKQKQRLEPDAQLSLNNPSV